MCVLPPLGGAVLLFLIWTVGGGGGVEVTWVYSRILAIGPKTEKNDQKSFLKGKHTRAASVNKTTND